MRFESSLCVFISFIFFSMGIFLLLLSNLPVSAYLSLIDQFNVPFSLLILLSGKHTEFWVGYFNCLLLLQGRKRSFRSRHLFIMWNNWRIGNLLDSMSKMEFLIGISLDTRWSNLNFSLDSCLLVIVLNSIFELLFSFLFPLLEMGRFLALYFMKHGAKQDILPLNWLSECSAFIEFSNSKQLTRKMQNLFMYICWVYSLNWWKYMPGTCWTNNLMPLTTTNAVAGFLKSLLKNYSIILI